ncbi:MAG: ATP-binding cassette domain-containing protein [Micropruina sp.]|uniref:ABC transporter ATP-binding protein n=1 Tax=Micropruina sp. TaxID=2737536 RepID=UPI0039E61B12
MNEARTTDVLRVRELDVARGGVRVLRGVDLTARAGRVHVVLGASGSGKTTLLRACIGLVPAPSTVRAAELLLVADGSEYDLTRGDAWAAVRGEHIGRVGQDPALDLTPLRRVGSLVAEASGPRRTPVPEVLERCGLPGQGLQRRMCFQLSGGMAQRLALGLAGARDPDLLLADEPSTALDAIARATLARHLREVADADAAVVLVTHDVALARTLADDVTVLDGGRVVEQGEAGQVLTRPATATTRELVAVAVPRPRVREAGTDGDPVLRIDGLVAGWDRRPVLDGVDLRVGPGEVLGVAGRSGAGKSTLVACLTGLLAPSAGRMTLAGLDVGTARWRDLRRRIQLVPQDPRGSLNPWRTVADQIRDPLDVHRVGTRAERRDRVDELLDRVGLAGLGERRPGALSTGQCQRVAIARALAIRPRLLIADEPVTALDAALRADALELFADVVRSEGTAALVISHDLHVLEYLSDRIAVLDAGRIVEELPAHDLRTRGEHPLTLALLAAHPPMPEPDLAGVATDA